MSQAEIRPEATLDTARQETAKKYAGIRRRLGIGELTLTGVLLLIMAFSGISHRITSLFNLPVVPAAVVFMAIILVAYEIITAPPDYYGGFVLPRRYGLSIEKFGGWLKDELKGKGLGLLLGTGMTALLYWFISDFPQAWWLMAWGAAIVFGVIMAHLAPIIIVPLFLKMKPLANEELKQRLEKLTRKAGVRIRGVYTLELSKKGTTANAALMGMANTRRIVLTDTLLEKYTPEEIEVIIAHELGHHRLGDIPRALILQSGIILIILYLTSIIFSSAVRTLGYSGITDVAALPLLILIIAFFGLLVGPLLNTYQRHRETAADDFALRLTDNPQAFISMMTKLTNQNLGEAEPPRWVEVLMHDHPSYNSRVQSARRYSDSTRLSEGS